MSAMVGTLRVSRVCGLAVVCVTALTAAVVVGGCSRVVTGTARAGDHGIAPARPISVADLLIDPTRFPARYPAARLPPKDIERVWGEIDGVAAGSEVTPPECAPLPMLADQKAAIQGTDEDDGSRLIVTIVRPVPSVRARVAQLADCPSFTSTIGGETGQVSKVTVDLPPPPPVDADDSYAVEVTVTPKSSDAVDTRTLTLVALVSDVRVTASWQQGSADEEPDTQALDTLFTAAVLKVRQEIPR